MKHVVEITRSNVTPSQFLTYVKASLKRKNLVHLSLTGNVITLKEFSRKDNIDLHKVYTMEEDPFVVEQIVIEDEYIHKVYSRNRDGEVYHEHIEFNFDDEKRGWGYYYLVCDVEDQYERAYEDNESAQNTEYGNDMPLILTRSQVCDLLIACTVCEYDKLHDKLKAQLDRFENDPNSVKPVYLNDNQIIAVTLACTECYLQNTKNRKWLILKEEITAQVIGVLT